LTLDGRKFIAKSSHGNELYRWNKKAVPPKKLLKISLALTVVT
jgi:hypothetical protein